VISLRTVSKREGAMPSMLNTTKSREAFLEGPTNASYKSNDPKLSGRSRNV
jgi:hypothetical protein